jgi:hypothetical protein
LVNGCGFAGQGRGVIMGNHGIHDHQPVNLQPFVLFQTREPPVHAE